jgi:hypothetical protein
MAAAADVLSAAQAPQRHFCGLYLRSTTAMADELASARFADREWVGRLTVAFAGSYLDALERWQAGERVPLTWQLAFEAPAELSPLVHELIGLNAHLNHDLPQALLEVSEDGELQDERGSAQRRSDFLHIDDVMLRRLPEEYRHLRALGGPVGAEVLARLLYPLNTLASRKWLVAARRSVWHNAGELSRARGAGPAALGQRLADLDVLCAAKVDDLLRPGQVLLRLGVVGFGVTLPPRPAAPRPVQAPRPVEAPGPVEVPRPVEVPLSRGQSDGTVSAPRPVGPAPR